MIDIKQLERSVLAHQYLGGHDDKLVEFVRPATTVFASGRAHIDFEGQSFSLNETDWVVEIAPGLFERLIEDEFVRTYKR